MYKVFLSLRYLRSRPSNWIGMAGIFVAVTALILILSIMSGFLEESRKTLRGSLADVIIQPQFQIPRGNGLPLKEDPDRILEIVKADPRIEAASVQLQWYGILSPVDGAHRIADPQLGGLTATQLIGIDFEQEYESTAFRKSLTRTPRFAVERVADIDNPFAPPPGYNPIDYRPRASVILGEQLAANWSLHRGDELEIVTAGVDPQTGELLEPVNQYYVVAGTFRSGDNEFDVGSIYMERQELADLLGRKPDYSTVIVKLEDYERDKESITHDLRDALAAEGFLHDMDPYIRSREVRTWEDFRATMLAAIGNEKVLMAIMLALVMVVAGFTVFAILSMMVTEKRRDIGVLCALGATQPGILSMFVLIGFWEALIGSFLGAVFGVWGAIKIDSIELWLSETFNIQIFNRNVYLFDHIPSRILPAEIAMILVGAFVCTLLFALIPAWRASRLHPIDALRYE